MLNEWISVKEKVPENREWVLIIGEFTGGGLLRSAYCRS